MCGTKISFFCHEIIYEVPVVVYAGLIYLLSSGSSLPEDVSLINGIDKLAHFIEYFVFGFLIYRSLSNARTQSLKENALLLTILFGICFGISDEWHQSYVPGRDATIGDVLFDSLGIITAAGTYNTAMKKIPFLKKFDESLERKLRHEQ